MDEEESWKHLSGIFSLAQQAVQAKLDRMVTRATGMVVQSGPFTGMRLRAETSWGQGDLTPKLLGFYEQELHGLILALREKKHDAILNIGAAEGYYAVGLKRLLPQTALYAFDISTKAQEVLAQAARDNGVTGLLEIHGVCSPETLAALLARHGRVFLLVDCEGCELALLDPARVPGLGRADFLVECHDFLHRGLTQQLIQRFSASHELIVVREGARDPNASPLLRNLPAALRWLAVNENRPETMHWLLGWSREAAAPASAAV